MACGTPSGRTRAYHLLVHTSANTHAPAPQDYHSLGVRYIEETEELLERTGHLASIDQRKNFDREFIIFGEDYGMTEEEAIISEMEHEIDRGNMYNEMGEEEEEDDPSLEVEDMDDLEEEED